VRAFMLELDGVLIFPVILVLTDISFPNRAIFFSTDISLSQDREL